LQYYEQHYILNKNWQVSNVKNNKFIHYDDAFSASSYAVWCFDNECSNAQDTIRPTSQIKKNAPKCQQAKNWTFNVLSIAIVVQHQTVQMVN
jgi:hypothetical protein